MLNAGSRAPRGGLLPKTNRDRDDAKRTKAALAIWQSATPADGTLVETLSRITRPSSCRFRPRSASMPD